MVSDDIAWLPLVGGRLGATLRQSLIVSFIDKG
jgi:hypothetical protein